MVSTVTEMDSLEKLCLCFVARNASYFRTADFQVLNVHVLRQLVSYLGAYQLNRLHDVFIKAGVDVQRVWKRHLALHWHNPRDHPLAIFSSDSMLWNVAEPRRVYMERLFQKIIRNLDVGTDELPYVMNLKRLPKCRHGVCFDCSDSTPLDNNILQSELLQYAEHVQVLCIWATNPMVEYLLKGRSLLKVLQCKVRRLDVRFLCEPYFAATWELVRLFVQEGCVSEFSIFNARLASTHIENLLKLVSGQEAELRPDFLSALSEHRPVGDAVTACSLEREACTSVEVEEVGSRRFTECGDDVTTTDERRNLTGTDAIDVMETSSQASEDSVGSFSDLAGEDLYDVALTPSASSVDRFRSGHRALTRGDPISLPFASGSSGAASKPAGYNASSPSLLGKNRSRCERPDNSEASSVCGSASVSLSSGFPRRSCTSLTFAYTCGIDRQLWTVLVRVLRNWTTLQKLALFEVPDAFGFDDILEETDLVDLTKEFCNVLQRKEKDKENFRDLIYRGIQSDQLTHIVMYEVDFEVDVIDIVVNGLRTKENDRPLEELKVVLSPQQKFTYDPSFCDRTEDFLGIVGLNFCQSPAADTRTCRFVMALIRGDRALRRLHLPCFYDASYLTETLEILESNQRVEELHLDSNMFDASSASCLLSLLRSATSLRKLSLEDCGLTKNLIGESFVQAIAQHPTLTELNLEQNHLEEVGCDLLKAICLRKAFLFNSLNLGFNRIEGELLFTTCQEIQAELKLQHRVRFPLSELNLSGNIFHLQWRRRLILTLVDCIDVLVAQDPNLGNPAGPLADHVSQM